MFNLPPFIKTGDRIAIVATARKITSDEIQAALAQLRAWKLEVVLGENLFNVAHQMAGSDEDRTKDFQTALDDNSIKGILCARGGYGTVRIIDQIDFSGFEKTPKWIMGFSDITVLHSHIQSQLKTASIHGPLALNFNQMSEENSKAYQKVLWGEPITYQARPHAFNRQGKVSAPLIGGNLSVLYSLLGSASQLNADGKILFLEDLDEYLYHIDRMMMALKRSGCLNKLAGLIVGGMTEMNDNQIPFGKTAEKIIIDAVKEFDYPVCFDFPAGHVKENLPLIFGKDVQLEVSNRRTRLSF